MHTQIYNISISNFGISRQKTKYQPSSDTLREIQLSQFYSNYEMDIYSATHFKIWSQTLGTKNATLVQ